MRRWYLFLACSVLAASFAVAAPKAPRRAKVVAASSSVKSEYIKKDTWQDTLRASKEAQFALEQQQQQTTPAAPRIFVSRVMLGQDAPLPIKVDITGWKELYLIVDDCGNYTNDVANWAEARLVAPDGEELFLDTIDPSSAQQAFGKFKRDNKSTIGGPMKVANVTFKRGLGTHARSVIVYPLCGKHQFFQATVGVDASRPKGAGEVKFIVADHDPGAIKKAPDVDLWAKLALDFSDSASARQMKWEQADRIWDRPWKSTTELAGRYARATRAPMNTKAAELAKGAKDDAALVTIREIYYRSRELDEAQTALKGFNFDALRLAINDLTQNFGDKYPNGPKFLQQLDELQKATPTEPEQIAKVVADLQKLRQDALLANPLIDFEKLMLIRRSTQNLGLPANWQSNACLPRSGIDNEILTMSPVAPGGKLATLYKPAKSVFVGDIDLHFDAGKMLFSSIAPDNRWEIFELKADGTGLRQVTGDQPDVDYYDACYLPDGRIIATSTAPFIGVPCVNGSSHVTNMYIMNDQGKNIRQLTVDQEHSWCPQVLNNGRILYLRWEYTDTPHSNTRVLFHMNPDGTNQMAYYGSNSYWPNGVFYARPVPNHPTKVVGIVTGHHGVRRMGELVVFDPARANFEADGVVQRIPGYGKKVEPVMADQLVNASWPKFLHPYPLSDKYFIVSCQPSAGSLWGVYLVDVFDNMLLLAEMPGNALLEPIPVKKQPKPPVIQDRIDPSSKEAVVYINDIYHGQAMRGIPRGTVKQVRIFEYHFAYHGMGGLLGVIGMNGPWDIRRTMGTAPVEEDGSVAFKVPAYTPISIQPLDEHGQAVQVMRSWYTAMPGEKVTCAGCHEKQISSPPNQNRAPIAFTKPPAEIKPWLGPRRGFSYAREVQPVIDRYCIGCHDGKEHNGVTLLDFRGTEKIKDFKMVTAGHGGANAGKFSVGYANLHQFIRHPGIESDYHVLMPTEFQADTTHLVQILNKGHYGVKLDAEAWDRLITWIDFNTPFHGTWGEELANPGHQRERRRELRKLYTSMDDDPEEVIDTKYNPGPFVMPDYKPAKIENVQAQGWPFDAQEAAKRQAAAKLPVTQTIDLGSGVKIEMTLVPAGEFVMGDATGYDDEKPLTKVKIDRPFYMARCEITNAQFAAFDPRHDSHVESKQAYQFGVHGYPEDGPDQPVVRISWNEAMAFCKWLSEKTGQRVTLPTEAQWEYACRAGTATPLSFGDINSDFSKFANVADAKLSEFASNPYTIDQVQPNRTKYDDYVPKEMRYNDGSLVTANVGKYAPNAFGLFDMHGNAAEWTRTTYKPYPYDATDGRDAGDALGRKVVRGGSWRDRPKDCRSANRLSYPAYRGVYNVSFRIICDPTSPGIATAGK